MTIRAVAVRRSIFILLFLACSFLNIQAQNCALPEHFIEEMYDLEFIQNNTDFIHKVAHEYGVPADALVFILHYEIHDNNLKDWGQKQLACLRIPQFSDVILKGTLLASFTPNAQAAFESAYADDQQHRVNNTKPEKDQQRDAWEHWIFTSYGAAQLQPYTVAVLIKDKRLKNQTLINRFTDENGQFRFVEITEALVEEPEVTIEALAAELSWAQDVYKSNGIDISSLESPCEIFRQLHCIGYFDFLAKRRIEVTRLALSSGLVKDR